MGVRAYSTVPMHPGIIIGIQKAEFPGQASLAMIYATVLGDNEAAAATFLTENSTIAQKSPV